MRWKSSRKTALAKTSKEVQKANGVLFVALVFGHSPLAISSGHIAVIPGLPTHQAFAGVCKAIQQVLASPAGKDRQVFMTAVRHHIGVQRG